MNLLKRLSNVIFGRTSYEYHPVSQWIYQGEHGYHNGDWSKR